MTDNPFVWLGLNKPLIERLSRQPEMLVKFLDEYRLIQLRNTHSDQGVSTPQEYSNTLLAWSVIRQLSEQRVCELAKQYTQLSGGEEILIKRELQQLRSDLADQKEQSEKQLEGAKTNLNREWQIRTQFMQEDLRQCSHQLERCRKERETTENSFNTLFSVLFGCSSSNVGLAPRHMPGYVLMSDFDWSIRKVKGRDTNQVGRMSTRIHFVRQDQHLVTATKSRLSKHGLPFREMYAEWWQYILQVVAMARRGERLHRWVDRGVLLGSVNYTELTQEYGVLKIENTWKVDGVEEDDVKLFLTEFLSTSIPVKASSITDGVRMVCLKPHPRNERRFILTFVAYDNSRYIETLAP